jgi:hypothetical protein
MDNVKITKDGFVWLIVTDSAKELFSSGALPIYELYEDGTEALITGQLMLQHALNYGNDIGVEIGSLSELNDVYAYQSKNQ